MMQRHFVATTIITTTFLAAAFVPARADDTAVAVAAGGIQLRKEARISMDEERLTITPDKVSVDFWFRNETDSDITTDVAFPIPPYRFDWDSTNGPHDFADFEMWVDGQQVPYRTDARATLKGQDYTGLLESLGVDVATFGKYDWKKDPPDGSPQISAVSASNRQQLVHLGLLDSLGDAFPQWTVTKMYYWRQDFPAGKLVHIRHVYVPVIGAQAFQPEEIQAQLKNTCISAELYRNLKSAAAESLERSHGLNGGDVYANWVNYILTTANTWKTPIKDFELVIDAPPAYPDVSFCWDGPIEKLGLRTWRTELRDFIPRRDLAIYFFGVPQR